MRKILCLFFMAFSGLVNCFATSKTNSGLLFPMKYFTPTGTTSGDKAVSALQVNLPHLIYQEAIPDSLRKKYSGVYQMSMDKGRTMEILIQENQLVAKYGKDMIFLLTPKSATEFVVEGIQSEAVIKFIVEKGKVTRYIVYQNGPYEWKKIK